MTLPSMPAPPTAPEPTKRKRAAKPKNEVVRAGDLDWSAVARDVWLIAGTPISEPYPCRCEVPGRCWNRCPCAGRTDTAHLPQYCCAASAGRRQTLAAGPVPLPPIPVPRVSKLRAPAPVDLPVVIAALMGLAS